MRRCRGVRSLQRGRNGRRRRSGAPCSRCTAGCAPTANVPCQPTIGATWSTTGPSRSTGGWPSSSPTTSSPAAFATAPTSAASFRSTASMRCRSPTTSGPRSPVSCGLVLDPATDPVEDWLRVESAEDAGSLCWMVPGVDEAADAFGARRTKHSISFFALNYGTGLIQDRLEMRKRAVDLLDKVDADPHDYQARTDLQRMASRYQPHACIARQLLEALEPSILPSRARGARLARRRPGA